MKLGSGWTLPLLLIACSEAPLTTIDVPCGYGESTFEIATSEANRHVIVVIDREQARDAEPRLRQLVSALITGEVDDGGERILRHDESIRLSIASFAEAAANVRAGKELHFIRYQNAPHGYADDLEGFLDRLPCLYGPMPAACADVAGAVPIEVPSSELIVIGAESVDAGTVDVIASAVHEQHIAHVAAVAPDYRPALFELDDCSQFYPSGGHSLGLDTDRFEVEADGRFACQLFETLPSTGPITRCAQLESYGRRFEAIASDSGREVCEVEQVRQDEAETRYGWLIPAADQFRLSWPEGEPELGCIEARALYEGVPTFTWLSRPIAGADYKLRCALAVGTEQPSCEDL